MLKLLRIFIKYVYFLIFFLVTLLPLNFNFFFHNIQIIPAIFRLINNFTILTILIFLILLISTFIFGRYYCQYICPLGILQDIIPSIKFLHNKINWIKNIKIKFILRVIFFILLVIGLNNFLEPYSIFTKIVVYPIKTFFYWIYNLFIIFFKNFKIYLSPLKYNIDNLLLSLNISFLIFLIIFNLFRKRFFCNFICPAATILNTISKYPVIKILFNNNCIYCGVCEKNCPTQTIDVKNKKIDYGECILCMKCIYLCKYNGISYNLKQIDIKNNFFNQKRVFISGLFSIPLLFISNKLGFSFNKLFFNKKNNIIIPPGSKSIDYLLSKCISCSLCIIQCPTKVIRFENFIPILDYKQKYCLYECKRCSEICPVDAIKPISLLEKKITQIGISNFFIEYCIVYKDQTDCGACSEHCPTKAVYMIPYKNGLLIPQINKEICIGCGACEYACPSKPKSIIVKSNSIHKKALLPENNLKNIEKFNDKTSDNFDYFPF